VPHGLRDSGLEALRDHVFEPLRLLVDLVPFVTQNLHEEGLKQPVVAEHLQRHPPPRFRQADAPVPGVLHQTELGEPAHHLGDRCRSHFESMGKSLGTDLLPTFTEDVNLLEIIFLGL
jgi:hypothetical protein